MIKRLHPVTLFLMFFVIILISMFFGNPAVYAISFVTGCFCYRLTAKKENRVRTFAWIFLIVIVSAVLNPFVSHNGSTVLLVINDKVYTLEALIYGFVTGLQVGATLLWFLSLSKVLTSEKLMCVFGKISPRLSLMLSMILKFIPDFRKDFVSAKHGAMGIGCYKEDNGFQYVKQRADEFTVVAVGALENGIITADSMESRGFSLGKRTSYSRFKFRTRDGIVLLLLMLGLVAYFVLELLGNGGVSYYPEFTLNLDIMSYIKAGIFTFFSILPVFSLIKK